jgi:sigma-B regulation protein RsbU (phosphoserine phosphatase)
VHWHDTTVTVDAGVTLVAYTDGVTDATGADRARFGPERLRATLERCRGLSASAVLDALTDALEALQVGAQADDPAVLALRRSGAE